MTGVCARCGFGIWLPVGDLPASTVGLYDDARFPGRVIVSAHEHHEHLDEMPADALAAFMADVARTSRAVRSLDGVERVNVAVLGNQEPHVHAHVIPRRAGEVNAGKAPWDEAPPRRKLNDWNRLALTRQLRSLLDGR